MTKLRAIVFFAVIFTLALGVQAVAAPGEGPFFQLQTTPEQSAVFAAFMASGDDGFAGPEEPVPIVTTLSVSNVLAAPTGPTFDVLFRDTGNTQGTVELYLWNIDGDLIFYETHANSPGFGLNPDGTLAPGQTWIVLLEEILEDAGLPRETLFIGYGWVVANFDAVAGTYHLTFFRIGFTQNYVLEPAMGTAGFFGGIPVEVPVAPPVGGQ